MSTAPPQFESREALDAFLNRFLLVDWESANGPIRFCSDMSLDDLQGATFFKNAQVFLKTLYEEDGTTVTATGNLNRKFVRTVFDGLSLSPAYRDSIRHVCKVINEMDVWPLHLVRVVSELAGFVKRRKGRFYLTKAGRLLLSEDQAGALYRKLFITYFRRLDLRYVFHLREVPSIQDTMAVILWRLDTVVRDWVPVKGLAHNVLMLRVLEELRAAMTYPHDTEEWIFSGYVLDPLFNLGLIEKKDGGEWPNVTDKDEIRLTALWRKFIEFDRRPK